MAKKTRVGAPQRDRTAARADPRAADDLDDLADDLLRAHRRDLAAGRALLGLLLRQLKEAAESRPDLEGDIAALTENHKKPDRRHKLAEALSISAHVRLLGDLVTALRNLVPLERQAFDLDPLSEDDDATGLAERLRKARSRLDGRT